MTGQAFLLDSNATGYAEFLAALATYNAAHFNFTPTLTTRDFVYDSTLKIVFANVSESEIDSDEDLADARLDAEGNHQGTELVRMRIGDLTSFRVRGFHMLGESERSSIGIAGQDYYCVRQKRRAASGTSDPGGWGEATGRTMYDAANGCEDTAIFTAGTWPEGAALVDLCGPLISQRINVATSPDNADLRQFLPNPAGDFSANPLTFRMDNPFNPGMVAGSGALHDQDYDGSGANRAWTQDGTNPNVWHRITGFSQDFSPCLFLDPRMSSTDVLTKGFLQRVADVDTVRTTDWSCFKDEAGELWVNIPTGVNPRFRVISGGASGAWEPAAGMNDATTHSKGIRYVHCSFVFCGDLAGNKTGEYEWRGCRWVGGTTYFPHAGVGPTTYIGWSEDGEIPWALDDYPDPDTDVGIQRAVGRGSDLSVWQDKITRFTRIHGSSIGIYEAGGGFDAEGYPKLGFTIEGLIGIGIGNYVDTDRKLSFVNEDGHVIGTQGVSNLDAGYLYIDRGDFGQSKSPIEFYAINDSGAAQNLQNNHIHDFVIRDGNIIFGGPGAFKRRSGTGLLDGNEVSKGAMFSGGIFTSWNEELYIHHVDMDAEDRATLIGGAYNADMCTDTWGLNALEGYWAGPGFHIHDMIYRGFSPGNRVYNNNQTNWRQVPKTIVGISADNPAVVEVTAHGFPDYSTPAAGVNCHPRISMESLVYSGTALADGDYVGVWVDANHFALYTGQDATGAATGPVDGSALGTFTSGVCRRAIKNSWRSYDNTFVLADFDINTTWVGIGGGPTNVHNASDSIAQVQALPASANNGALPGMINGIYEENVTIIDP